MITIDWGNKIINVPKSETQLVQSSPTEIRQLDLNAFRLDLKALEASAEGVDFVITHVHTAPITVGGVTLARVVEIINDYTITFEDGQYAVNLVGANSNVGDVTNVNQVSIRSANSAGLTFSDEINNQSFINGRVFINTDGDGLPGTQFPRGTFTSPVDNFMDAQVIASTRNFNSYKLEGTITPAGGDDLSETGWLGASPIKAAIVFGGQNVDGATFERIGITGTMMSGGRASYQECAIGGPLGVANIQGVMDHCGFNNVNIGLDAAATENIYIRDCSSVIAGTSRPTLNCNGTSADIHVRGYYGGITITNFTSGNNMSIDVDTATIEIDASCTAGTINIGGEGSLIDNSGPGCTVVTSRWNEAGAASNPWSLPVSGNQTSGSFGEFVTKKLLKAATFFGLK